MEELYTNCDVLTNGARYPDSEVLVEDGIVCHLGPAGSFQGAARVIDLNGGCLAPGFIDLQVNGAGGALFQESPTIECLKAMAAGLRSFGTTSFLPTITTCTSELRRQAISSVCQFAARVPHNLLGINLEGPFVNPKKAGMSSEAQGPISAHEFKKELSELRGLVAFVTVAPEVIPGVEISSLVRLGATVSIGHSMATFQEAQGAFRAGASVGTHLFNAMTGIAGREPGVAGAVLDSPGIFTSLIADGHHVHPANARLVTIRMGLDRVFLISDGMPPLGSGVESFDYLGKRVVVTESGCKTEEGVLAGTAVPLIEACKNMANWSNISFSEALPMITSTPAKVVGLEGVIGTLRPGAVANLVVLGKSLEVRAVHLAAE